MLTKANTNNPFGFVLKPQDPNTFFYDGNNWIQAQAYVKMTYAIGDYVSWKGRIYQCENDASACSTYAPDNPYATGAWISRNSTGPEYPNNECPLTFTGPVADPQTDMCVRSDLSGPGAACVNPCIRLANGKLAVNSSNSNQCRVFPNVTPGGSSIGTNCPTVCPSACVELWESCPVGTGILSTMAQTKRVEDLMALTGPTAYDVNGSPIKNKYWPINYVTDFDSKGITGGKPYTECYAYNTDFCELPSARQQSVTDAQGLRSQVCYANCPVGTTPSDSDPNLCIFISSDIVMCNPQYYDTEYASGASAGKAIGCRSKALPTKSGTTCPFGTEPLVNDHFNIEWCMPTCPSGFTNDLSFSTCIATCEISPYNAFIDYVDFYATQFRCALDSSNQEIDCIQNNTPGRCPLAYSEPPTFAQLAINIPNQQAFRNLANTNPANVRLNANSISTQWPEKLLKDGLITQEDHTTFVSMLSNLSAFQQNHKTKTNISKTFYGGLSSLVSSSSSGLGSAGSVNCPPNMKQGVAMAGENPNFCYDQCEPGYEVNVQCNNGQSPCAPQNRVFTCVAKCPVPSEGLGPWDTVKNPASCVYKYPNGILPQDPNLWVTCPDDGRYSILQSSTLDAPTSDNAGQDVPNRTPPMCICNFYLRQYTCPIDFNISPDGQECTAACNSGEMLTTVDGVISCQDTATGKQSSNRHENDIFAIAQTQKTADLFKGRVQNRKNIPKSLGSDPNRGMPDNSSPPTNTQNIVKYVILIVSIFGGILVFKMLTGKKKPSNK